jgi:hypothetical protein
MGMRVSPDTRADQRRSAPPRATARHRAPISADQRHYAPPRATARRSAHPYSPAVFCQAADSGTTLHVVFIARAVHAQCNRTPRKREIADE